MSEFALDKLQKTAEAVPAEQRTPELQLLLQFAECFREAEEKLKTVDARRKEGAAVQELLDQPETFQGLAQFVRAVALGAEAAGVGLCSAEVLTLLKEALLQPIITREQDGSYQAHRPSVACPTPSPLNILQLLASGVFLHITGNSEPGIAMLSAALSGVWPPSRAMQRRLVARQFVPTVGGGEGQVEAAAGAGAQSGGGSSSSSSEPAGSSVEESAAPPSAGGDGGASGSRSQPPTSAALSSLEEKEGEEAPTPLAAALGQALAQHCPGVSLADVQKAALVLRLFLGCRAVGEQEGDGPSLQAILRTLLMDCQQLLELDPSCQHAYVWAAQLLLYARWPMDRRRVRGLYEEGARRARAAQCWLAAGEVGHDYAMWLVSSAAGDRNVAAKHAALLEAGKLLDGVKEAEEALASWVPAGRLHQLTARREQLDQLLRQLQKGQRGTLGAVRAGSDAPACAFCGQPCAQLRACAACKAVGYCSRQCQLRDWKAGHKAVCAAPPSGAQPAAGAAAAAGAETAAAQ